MPERMFQQDGKRVRTWNPISGCLYSCSFCWARKLAEGRLRHTARYAHGFAPALNADELGKRFKAGETVFVVSMGDMWGNWVPAYWIYAVLWTCRESPETRFLFLTKNPGRYAAFLGALPPLAYLGATIESTYVEPEISKAPRCWERYIALAQLDYPRKFVSIEPIIDFSLGDNGLDGWIKDIAPEFVYIGYDNHHCHLREPSLAKTLALIEVLGKFTEVRLKTVREKWDA